MATDLAKPIDPKSDADAYVGGDWWWRVCSPYVTVKTSTTEGMRIIGLHRGAPLPVDVQPEQVKHHADHGLIERFAVTKAERQHLADDPPGGPGVPEPGPPAAEQAAGQAPTPAAASGSSSPPKAGGTSARGGRAADK